MSAALLRSDATAIPLGDNTVDLIVTSPPYFALRSYQDGGEHYDGQIGSEDTPTAFLEALWAVTAECWRVLKPSGSLFVNLGDKYAGSNGASGAPSKQNKTSAHQRQTYAGDFGGIRSKSLMGLPWRYAIGCIDGQADPDGRGWVLRSEIIWCLSGGAKVYALIHGRPRPVMLRDLARHYQPEDVKLWNGDKWTQVLGWNRSTDKGEPLELELRSGERIGCTPGHRWPTTDGLKRADELAIGDVLTTTALPDQDDTSSIGYDLGWLVGLYLAEGSMSGRTIQFAGHANEHERLAKLQDIARRWDGSCHVYTDGNKANITLTGAVLCGVLERYLSPGAAHTKRLTHHAWARGNDFLRAIVDGYLSGDGHYDEPNDRWRLGFTANDEWASDLRTLAARLGASLTLKRATHQGFDREWPGWRGEWRWDTSRQRIDRAQIVAIRRSRARQFFDVGVEDEPHLFALASGVLTHNSKPNGLPESVTDRVRRSHEQWFHLTKEGRYYSNVDEVREEAKYPDDGLRGDAGKRAGMTTVNGHRADHVQPHPLGKLPGSVWTVPTQPLIVPDWLDVDHFAAFPTEWPRRLILGWSPPGICVECGEGRRAVVDKVTKGQHLAPAAVGRMDGKRNDEAAHAGRIGSAEATITGTACACDKPTAPTTPAVVLDPFSGTGTVAGVARALGRYGVGCDLSADYMRLARWRIWQSGMGAKVESRTNGERQGVLL